MGQFLGLAMRMYHPVLPETLTAPVEVTAEAFEVCWSQPQPPHRLEGWKAWPPNPEIEPYADALAAALKVGAGDRDKTIRALAVVYDRDTAVSIYENLVPPERKPAPKTTTKSKEQVNG